MRSAALSPILLAGFASAASAMPADHLAPADVHRYWADGKRVTTGGDLLSVSDRCLSLDAGRKGAMFAIRKSDAELIRRHYRETGHIFLLIEGIYRKKLEPVPGATTPSPCGEAGLEQVIVVRGSGKQY